MRCISVLPTYRLVPACLRVPEQMQVQLKDEEEGEDKEQLVLDTAAGLTIHSAVLLTPDGEQALVFSLGEPHKVRLRHGVVAKQWGRRPWQWLHRHGGGGAGNGEGGAGGGPRPWQWWRRHGGGDAGNGWGGAGGGPRPSRGRGPQAVASSFG